MRSTSDRIRRVLGAVTRDEMCRTAAAASSQGSFAQAICLPGTSTLGTSFIHANLREADFTGAMMRDARLYIFSGRGDGTWPDTQPILAAQLAGIPDDVAPAHAALVQLQRSRTVVLVEDRARPGGVGDAARPRALRLTHQERTGSDSGPALPPDGRRGAMVQFPADLSVEEWDRIDAVVDSSGTSLDP